MTEFNADRGWGAGPVGNLIATLIAAVAMIVALALLTVGALALFGVTFLG
jgi:hypothetical protein